MSLSTNRLFKLELMKREIAGCNSVERLREVCQELLSLYLGQQQAIEQLISIGWLPPQTTTDETSP